MRATGRDHGSGTPKFSGRGGQHLVQQDFRLVFVGTLGQREFADQYLSALASIRFSPADRPRSFSRRQRSRTTSATL